MKGIIMITALACLAFACKPSTEELPRAAGQNAVATSTQEVTVESQAEVVDTSSAKATAEPQTELALDTPAMALTETIGSQTVSFTKLQKSWPSGADLQERSKGFMDTGFMKDLAPFGLADLAYSDIALDCIKDDQGRISQLNGVSSDIYNKYSFVIPVVRRRVDAISGSRQVNWEDIIEQIDQLSWRVQPVSLTDGLPLIVSLEGGIEYTRGDTITRITKTGTVFNYSEFRVDSSGKETPLVSWKIDQYELGLVQDLSSGVNRTVGVPVFLFWEAGSIAGYLVSLPNGEAELVARLKWEAAGNLETDRYNYLVLLSQVHGNGVDMKDRLGTVDPVLLALLMYDHVVAP